MAINTARAWMTICASLLVASCSSTHISHEAVPERGLTVSELYHQSTQAQAKPLPRKVVVVNKTKSRDETFKALPNPEVPLYVFAHVTQLGDEQLIKPAYTTRFFLYKQNQFALASELY